MRTARYFEREDSVTCFAGFCENTIRGLIRHLGGTLGTELGHPGNYPLLGDVMQEWMTQPNSI